MSTTTRQQMIAGAQRALASIEAQAIAYRETAREAVRSGVTQVDLAAALGISREKLRDDLRTEAERAAKRDQDTAYRAGRRGAPEAMRADRKPWPECDCSRPKARSLFQHDAGCRAVVEFERAAEEQRRAGMTPARQAG